MVIFPKVIEAVSPNVEAFNRELFNIRARRYCAALATAPRARALELVPLLPLLASVVRDDPGSLTAVDHLCGQGHVSSFLRGVFGQVVGVDQSEGMLKYYPQGAGLRLVRAGAGELSRVMSGEPSAKVVVSLAGLHHICALRGGVADPDESARVQRQMVVDWARVVPADGALVVIDVTGRRASAEPLGQANAVPLRGVFREHFETLRGELPWMPARWPASIDDYIAQVDESFKDLSACTPAGWFEEVVCVSGEHGHVAHFPDPPSLHEALSAAGCRAVYREIPTPWFFKDEGTALVFLQELFSLGSVLTGPDPRRLAMIRDAARAHLGLRIEADGTVITGWRLGFHVITKDATA